MQTTAETLSHFDATFDELAEIAEIARALIRGGVCREVRQQRGLRLRQLADQMHTTVATASRWEAGRTRPCDRDALHFARLVLGDTLETWVANWEEGPVEAEGTAP